MIQHNAHDMCITAHLSSAIIHADKMCAYAYKLHMNGEQRLDRKKVIAFIDDAMKITSKELSPMAEYCGVSHSTVIRYYNNPNPKHDITIRTLNKIARKIGYTSYEDYIEKKMLHPEHILEKKEVFTPEQMTIMIKDLYELIRRKSVITAKTRKNLSEDIKLDD